MIQRYLSVECQTFEPYQLPHSPQRILLEKGCTPLWYFPAFSTLDHIVPNHAELLRQGDCLVVPFHVVLRNLSLVLFLFLCQAVGCETLLRQGIAFVLLVAADALDRGTAPLILAARCLDAVVCDIVGEETVLPVPVPIRCERPATVSAGERIDSGGSTSHRLKTSL